jgi:hypothetical protein
MSIEHTPRYTTDLPDERSGGEVPDAALRA